MLNANTNDDTSQQQSSQPTEVLSSGKRRQSSRDVVDVLAEALKESSSNLCRELAEMRRDSTRHGPIDLDRAEEVYRQLMRIPNLTWADINKAHLKITESPSLVVAFSLVPEEELTTWVYSLLE